MQIKRSRRFLKILSVLVAVVFFWEQIVWAGGLATSPDIGGTLFQSDIENDTSQIDLDTLQSFESTQQSVVDRLQDIEDFSYSGSSSVPDALNLSLDTAAGDSAFYEQGQITQIEKSDGTVISGIVLEDDESLRDADVEYSDGTGITIRDGRISTSKDADGTVFTYAADGLVNTIEHSNGTAVSCTYIKDGNGNVLKTVLTDHEKILSYGNDGKLQKVEIFGGATVDYEDGMLSKITDPDGSVYYYSTEEDSSGRDTLYEATLIEIHCLGSKYYIENNNIVLVEFADGTRITDFALDENGSITAGIIERSDGKRYTIADGKVESIEYSDGTNISYRYTYIRGGDIRCYVTREQAGTIKEYSCTKVSSSGNVIIAEDDKQYEYNQDWDLLKVSDTTGVYEHFYDTSGVFQGTLFTSYDGSTNEYDSESTLIRTVATDGSIYEYFSDGLFAGKIKKAVYIDGQTVSFDYRVNEAGNLEVSRRELYDATNSYQGYYGNDYMDYNSDPYFKSTFRLSSSRKYSSFYSRASYYKYRERSVNLSVNVYGQTARLYYYSYNSTIRGGRDYRNEILDISIERDVDYTIEYLWTDNGVEIYLYESSQARPAEAVAVIADNRWNPKFYASGSNANISMDPASSGNYRQYNSSSCDYYDPLEGSPVHEAEFYFDDDSRKSISYSIYGQSDTEYDNVYLRYYNGISKISLYHYDYQTCQNLRQDIALDIDLASGVTYIVKSVTENNTLKLYLFEKGEAEGDPIYVDEDFSVDPKISTSVDGGTLDVEALHRLVTYEYDIANGNFIGSTRIASGEAIRYIYDDEDNILSKELLSDDGSRKVYDAEDRLLREEKATGEVTVYQYDADGNIASITPGFPDDVELSYYQTGDFAGSLEKAILPDGSSLYYRYKITDQGDLAVYKRNSYDDLNVYQGYYGNSYTDQGEAPSFKSTFTFSETKAYSNIYSRAYYYSYGDRSVTLSMNIYGQTPTIYYSSYDYSSRKRDYKNTQIDFTVTRGKEYTIEYIWENSVVNIYLYESGQARPGTPVYTLTDSSWSPKFAVSGSNADIVLSNTSSGTYTPYYNANTDYRKKLGDSPIHRAEFTFDANSANRSMYYNCYGRTSTEYDSIYFRYNNGIPQLSTYHYDYQTSERTNETIPIDITFYNDVTYVIQTEVEDNTFFFYIFEKGADPGDPVYTRENIDWTPDIYANVYGGQMNVEAYDELEVYEYNSQTGILLDSDVEEKMKNTGLFIESQDAGLPLHLFQAAAPLVYPDGITDVLDSSTIDLDLSITLPGDLEYSSAYSYNSSCPVSGMYISLADSMPDMEITVQDITQEISAVIAGIGEVTYISDEYYMRETAQGEIAIYESIGSQYLVSTYLDAAGTFTEYEYDEQGYLERYIVTSSDGVIEIYDSAGRIIEKREPETNFMKGINLPWVNYGYDLGQPPGSTYHIGYSSDKNALLEKFEPVKGSYVRVFLFCDLRSSIEFDTNGTPIAFTDKVYEDMRWLLTAAKAYNIKLMPTLFDFHLADGVSNEGISEVGEQPDLITDSAKRAALLNVYEAFFEEFAGDESVYAWDIMNEPEYAQAVTMIEVKTFVQEFTSLIHSKSPQALVTVGSKNRQSLVENWTDVGLDLYQFHYYDNFDSSLDLNYPEADLNLDKPVIAGELDPEDINGKLDTLYHDGYSGGFFWKDDSYTIDSAEYDAIEDYFNGIKITYEYHASGRKSREGYNNGISKEFEDHEFYADGNGRLLKEILATGAYKTYSYHSSTDVMRLIQYYLPGEPVDVLYSEEEFDQTGKLILLTLYYLDGVTKKVVRHPDGAWWKFDPDGELLEYAEVIEGIEVVYTADNKIEYLVQGTYREDRVYVYEAGAIQYTLALNDGAVKATREGEHVETDLISKTYTASSREGVTVTYDGGVSVQYISDQISSISVEDGYVNFYSEEGVESQNSSSGDLYEFEDGFLERVSTAGGDVYNFRKDDVTGGVIVSVENAIIGGLEYGFSCGELSYINDPNGTINIVALSINNNLSIGNLKVDRGSGTETIGVGDPVYTRIETLIQTVKDAIPNLKFEYSEDMEVTSVLTSGYSLIEMEGGLVSATVSPEEVRVDYDFLTDVDGVITGLRLLETGVTRTFDATGKLLSIELDDGVEQRVLHYEDGELTKIVSGEGVLQDIGFDLEGEIETANLIKVDGSEYMFIGGKLQDFIDDQDSEYIVDEDGYITEITIKSTGEILDVEYATDPEDDMNLVIFKSRDEGTEYIYKYIYGMDQDAYLVVLVDEAGITVDYEYDLQGRTSLITIGYGGVRNATYNFVYEGAETIVTDDLNNKRYYDENKKNVKLETPYGETYQYYYDLDADGEEITTIEYAEKIRDDGTVITYAGGQVYRIVHVDGSWIDNVEIDRVTGEVVKFSQHTADDIHRNVIIEGQFMQLEMEDGTRLVFYENTLVAFASSQGIVSLYDGVDELEDLVYERDRESGASQEEEVLDVAASSWRHQTYDDSMAINFVERDYEDQQWIIDLDLETGDVSRGQGEMYLDLRYDIPGLQWQAPIDMTDKEISFLLKMGDDFEHDPSYPCNIQVFAKDKDWNTQYGTKVALIDSTDWVQVTLIPSEEDINTGYADDGFDSSNVTMIGLRISQPDDAPDGINYLGKMLVKHDILPDLFANVNYDDNPLDDLYSGLGLMRTLDRINGDTEETDQELILESFVDALGNGPSNTVQESLLDYVVWHPMTENPDGDPALKIKGIESVYEDVDSGEIVADVELVSGSAENSEGEMFFDIRGDVPGLGNSNPVNFTARPISLLINVPQELITSQVYPTGARLFVVDKDFNKQYGTWINLKEGEKWYQLDITPTFGDIPMGFTDPGFDPSKIIRIGMSLGTQSNSNTNFQGEIRLKYRGGEIDPDSESVISMPLWMDLRNIREFLFDGDGNRISVPKVGYVAEPHYPYIFNQGSGVETTEDFDALSRSNTSWSTLTAGVSSVAWQGDNILKANLNGAMSTGDMMLDLRYNCYVPDRNWSTSADMSTQKIVFYVRFPEGYTSANPANKFSVEVFAKDYPSWRTEYGQKVYVDNSGSWQKVTLTPCPVDFNQGYIYHSSFDPEKIIGVGVRFRNLSGYTGPVEMKYQIEDISQGLIGDADGVLPTAPVWVNQRDLGAYLIENNIALFSDFEIMEELKQYAADIPGYGLTADFAARVVYAKDDKVTSISKPDGTTTYFNEQGQMDFITFSDGNIFMDYEYDENGDLIKTTLPTARNQARQIIDEALLEIEEKTADTLLVLAEQKSLIEENFMEDVNATRRQFANARSILEAQRYVEVKRGWWIFSWTERVEVPGVAEAISDLTRQEAAYNAQVAEQLALLDSELASKRDDIQAEKDTMLLGYSWQEDRMMVAIAHQEAIPLLHYYYRTILGRDTVEEEIKAAFRQINSNNFFAGFMSEDFTDLASFILALKGDIASTVYTMLSDALQEVISGFIEGEAIDDDTTESIMNEMDGIIRSDTFYDDLLAEYNSPGDLIGTFSAVTQRCYDYYLNVVAEYEGAFDLVDVAERRSYEEEIEGLRIWLNRCLIQDRYADIIVRDKDYPEFDASFLKSDLENSEEHTFAISFKRNVIDSIKVFFDEYVSSEASRTTLLAELLLDENEVVDVTERFRAVLYEWLEGQEIHFGKSAFESMKKLLEEKGVVVSLEEVALKSLLIDVLTGITGPLTDMDITISMFTMSKVSEIYGVDTDCARMTYDDIVSLGTPFLTLINKYHYVTVLSVTETEVTYWEENQGATGAEVTVSRKDFEGMWQGNVITDASYDQTKRLEASETKKIKGAFFGLLIGAIIAVMSMAVQVVAAVVTAVIGLVGSLVTIVGNLAAGLIGGIIELGKGLMFVGKAFLASLGVGAGAGAGAAAAEGTAIAAGTAGSGMWLGTLVHSATTTLIKVGVGYGVSIGLESLGVDPIISGIVSSIVTGGVSGFLGPTGGLGMAFKTALQWGASSAIGLLGQHFDLDPVISGILSMTTNAFRGAWLNPDVTTFAEAIGTVVQDVGWELAAYGVQYAGMSLGLDPGIASLAALTVRSSLQAGLSGIGGGGSPGDMWGAFVTELTEPANLALAFNVVGDALHLPPMINNMIITAVMGAIDGFNENPENRITGMFKGMLDNFWNASVRALTFGAYDPEQGGWNNNIQKDYALMNLTRFIDVVMEQGIEVAIENHLGNIFRDEAIRAINQKGGIADFLTGDAEMVQEGNVWLKKINVTNEDKLYLDPDTDNIVGRDYGDIKERGEYGTNPYTGGFGLIGGTIEQETGNGTRMVCYVSNSTVIDKMEVYGISGGHIQVLPTNRETGLQLNEYGIPIGGIVMDFERGKLYTYEYRGDSIDFELNFDDPNVDVQGVLDVDWPNLSNEEKEDVVNYYMVMNGIGNQNPYNSPGYMFNFETDLANADPLTTTEGIALIPLFNDMVPTVTADDLAKVVGDKAPFLFGELRDYGGYVEEGVVAGSGKLTKEFYGLEDASELLVSPEFSDKREEISNFLKNLNRSLFDDFIRDPIKGMKDWLKTEQVANKIYQNMQKEYGEIFPEGMTGLCYSGSGDPFVHLLNTKRDLDVSSLVLVGTPVKAGRYIENTKVKTVVNIFGEDDLFWYMNTFARRELTDNGDFLFRNNPGQINEFAIELKGVNHTHYFYDPTEPTGNIELKKRASKFIAEVTRRANDKNSLEQFLNATPGVKKDSVGKYIVDLEKVVY